MASGVDYPSKEQITLAPIANKNLLYKQQKPTTAFETNQGPFFHLCFLFLVICAENNKPTYNKQIRQFEATD